MTTPETALREALRSIEPLVDDLIAALEPGTTELMCHPAVVDEALRRDSSYAEPRGRELRALTDPRVRRAVERAGVHLAHFGDL